MNTIDRLRAEIAADSAAAARWAEIGRRMRPAMLRAAAVMDETFPPPSPTQARREAAALDPAWMDAVCMMLDAQAGAGAAIAPPLAAAIKNADPEFFRLLAEAAEHIQGMPQALSVFARHVIAARRVAADMLEGGNASKAAVKTAVIKCLGGQAYAPEDSVRWSEVWNEAGLKDLPRGPRERNRHGAGR